MYSFLISHRSTFAASLRKMKSILNLSALFMGFLALSQHKTTKETTSIVHKNPTAIFDPTPFAFRILQLLQKLMANMFIYPTKRRGRSESSAI
jgi:competence transcription factor ComK